MRKVQEYSPTSARANEQKRTKHQTIVNIGLKSKMIAAAQVVTNDLAMKKVVLKMLIVIFTFPT